MEVPSSAAGVIKELRVKVGDEVAQGAVIAVLEAESAGDDASAPGTAETPPAKAEPPAKTSAPTATGDAKPSAPKAPADTRRNNDKPAPDAEAAPTPRAKDRTRVA